jgi:hypothetical protein
VSDLQRELELLRAEIELPATPDLAGAVRERIAAGGRERLAPSPARRRPITPRRRLVLALVAALVLLAALAAVPSARDAVLDLFGLQGETVEVRPELPQREIAPGFRLGERVALDEARARADFHVLIPETLGSPQRVYLSDEVRGGEVTLSYRDGELLVSQFRGGVHPDYAGKIIAETNTVERIPGGVWIEGAPHFFFYRDPDGSVREDSLRLAGNVLLVERGPLLARIEGAPSKQRALEIADSLR